MEEHEFADKKAVDVKKAEEEKEIATKTADKKVSEEIAEQKKAEVVAETSEQAQQKAEERAIVWWEGSCGKQSLYH